NAVALDCDGGLLSSDAGRRRLKDPEEPRGFTRARAAVLTDPRAPRRVHLPWHALLTPRVWHMAAGSAEANAAHPLRHAPLTPASQPPPPPAGSPSPAMPCPPPSCGTWPRALQRPTPPTPCATRL